MASPDTGRFDHYITLSRIGHDDDGNVVETEYAAEERCQLDELPPAIGIDGVAVLDASGFQCHVLGGLGVRIGDVGDVEYGPTYQGRYKVTRVRPVETVYESFTELRLEMLE